MKFEIGDENIVKARLHLGLEGGVTLKLNGWHVIIITPDGTLYRCGGMGENNIGIQTDATGRIVEVEQ